MTEPRKAPEYPVRKGEIVVYTALHHSGNLRAELVPFWRVCEVASATRDGYAKTLTAPNWGTWKVDGWDVMTLSEPYQDGARTLLGETYSSEDACRTAVKTSPRTCEICGLVAPTVTHPCRFEKACRCWYGESCQKPELAS